MEILSRIALFYNENIVVWGTLFWSARTFGCKEKCVWKICRDLGGRGGTFVAERRFSGARRAVVQLLITKRKSSYCVCGCSLNGITLTKISDSERGKSCKIRAKNALKRTKNAKIRKIISYLHSLLMIITDKNYFLKYDDLGGWAWYKNTVTLNLSQEYRFWIYSAVSEL